MSTKFNLSLPYSADWRLGYLNTNSEGRKTIVLYNGSKNRSSVSYARYILAVKLGRYLTADEEAHHIDGNKKNDSIENIELVNWKTHKHSHTQGESMVQITCDGCKKSFARVIRNYKKDSRQYCSRDCMQAFMY